MHIWGDADACPGAIKDILFRAAERTRTPLTLVANRALHTPRSPHIKSVRVGMGFDVADGHIAQEVRQGDLVITADIPLDATVIAKGAHALNPRGDEYTPDNIRERLSLRNFMDDLRGTGIATGGPPALGPRDKAAFANALDRLLSQPRS